MYISLKLIMNVNDLAILYKWNNKEDLLVSGSAKKRFANFLTTDPLLPIFLSNLFFSLGLVKASMLLRILMMLRSRPFLSDWDLSSRTFFFRSGKIRLRRRARMRISHMELCWSKEIKKIC